MTLECIRRYYLRKESPLQEALLRYSDFFELFENFKVILTFFSSQDLVSNNYETINFYYLLDNFKRSSVPSNLDEYLIYKNKVLNFVKANSKNKSIPIKMT